MESSDYGRVRKGEEQRAGENGRVIGVDEGGASLTMIMFSYSTITFG